MPKDDLAGKNLDDIGFAGGNLQESDLSHASLRRSNLRHANLRGANLTDSDLREAHLQDADVTGADFSGADFTGANLDGVDLSRADTTGARGLPGVPMAGIELEEHVRPGLEKVAALTRIDAEHASWDAFIGSIPAAWLDLPEACGEWSVAEVIIHLSAWRRPFLDELQAVTQGTIPPPLDWPYTLDEIGAGPNEDEARVQAVNAWLHERNAQRTSHQALVEATLQWTLMRAIIDLMPDRLLADPDAFPWLDGQSLAGRILAGDLFRHFHDEHEPGLRAWLARMGGRPAAG